ncbi:hypothetical protein M3P21_21255 [Ruegeria sp. 2012CJ41-6]|uniref:Lysozyme inhibitor LprI-like N-terminal domain-containing protein n=1 Tax=Ruegeria spongiae TaxID=2942209 RepID=A0ABT0Q8Z5_9RHOB|nr:hypothetical protein [Ruegeria spongiae]MCL6286047.1 hypothetical protein [Ruegeria spongiae]
MPTLKTYIAAVVTIFSISSVAMAQQLLDQYTAVIGQQDRVNSSGKPLSKPEHILAQDRANFHRFGIRQVGDTADAYFNKRENRSNFSRLLSNGSLEPGLANAILHSPDVTLKVEIFGRSSVPQYVNVTLAQTQNGQNQLTITGSPTQRWVFESDQHNWQGAAFVQDATGRSVSLGCTRPGTDPTKYPGGGHVRPHNPGNLILFVSPQALGGGFGIPRAETISIELSVDGTGLGTAPMILITPEMKLATTISVNHSIFGALRVGSAFSAKDARTGQNLSIPLAGFSAALDNLIAFCAAPLSQPLTTSSIPTSQSTEGTSSTMDSSGASGDQNRDAGTQQTVDCNNPITASHKIICASPKLKELDRQIAVVFQKSLEFAESESDQQELLKSQNDWLEFRAGCDNSRNQDQCILNLTNSRLGILIRQAKAKGFDIVALSKPIATEQTPVVLSGTDSRISIAPQPTQYGQWYATTTCIISRKEVAVDFEFGIVKSTTAAAKAPFQSRMVMAPDPSVNNSAKEINYIGELDPTGTGQITFVRDNVNRYSGFQELRPERFTFDPNSGKGSFPDVECRPFAAKRLSQDSERILPSAVRPANGGSFWAGTSSRERCEAIIAWTDKLKKEYPDRDFFRSNQKGDEWRIVRLFADDDFVPVFGQPYDRISLENRRTAEKEIKACMTNAFTRDRMEPYKATAQDLLYEDPKDGFSYGGHAYAVFALRKIRAARNRINIALTSQTETPPTTDFESALQSMESAKEIVRKYGEFLWPSERQEYLDAIDSRREALASAESESRRNAILAFADELSRIAAIESALSDTRLKGAMTAGSWSKFERHLREQRQASAKAIAEPVLELAASQPLTLGGALAVNAELQQGFPGLSAIPSDLRPNFETSIIEERDKRLEAAINMEVLSLDGFKGTKSSLLKQAAWFDQFQQTFSAFSDTAHVRSAVQRYRIARGTTLEQALDGFIEEVLTANTSEKKDDILKEYLSQESDYNFPVALEYRLYAQ